MDQAVGKRMARYRADSASYQALLINELEADQVRWAIMADQDVAVKAVIAGVPAEAWQEPEQGCGYQVTDAVHTIQATDLGERRRMCSRLSCISIILGASRGSLRKQVLAVGLRMK